MSRKRNLPAWMSGNGGKGVLLNENGLLTNDCDEILRLTLEKMRNPQRIANLAFGKPMKLKSESASKEVSKKPERVLPASLVDPKFLEKNLPFLKFPGRIKYTHMKDECSFYCYQIMESFKKPVVCGFDIEWRVICGGGQGQRPTAVVQICISQDICYIFQVSAMNGFPVELKNLIESETIMKAGIGISGDVSKLKLDFNIRPEGIIDLSTLSNRINKTYENWSLNGLLTNLLKKQLNKDRNIRCGNWEQYPLTERQLDYAATDAYACLLIYEKLHHDDINSN